MNSVVKKFPKYKFAICCASYLLLITIITFVIYNLLFRTGFAFGGAEPNAKLALFGSVIISLFTLGAAILTFFGVSRGVSTQRQALQNEIDTRVTSERDQRERNLRERFGATIELLSHERSGIVSGSLYAAVALANDWFRFGSDYSEEEAAEREVQVIANLMSSTLREKSNIHNTAPFDSGIRDTFCQIMRSFYTSNHSPWKKIRWDLSNSNLSGADLRKVRMSNSNFSGSNFDGSMLQGAILEDCNFISASFVGAKFRGANVADSNFKDANMRLTNFCHTHIARINLFGADISDAAFCDPNRSDTSATGWKAQQFSHAISNGNTIFP